MPAPSKILTVLTFPLEEKAAAPHPPREGVRRRGRD